MEHILEIQNLSKHFGKLKAVDELSFSVEKGNVYGLLGPNGSGKSTTLGMILNVINPSSGSWKWFGQTHSTSALKRIGATIERPNFYPYLSADKNLKIVANIKEAPLDKIDEKLELVGLLDRKKDKFKTYSLGMKQRLAIAAALLNDPEVLILDEPTNGLDPQGIIEIREIIQRIATNGTSIILASHLLDEVEKVCSHVVVLQKGKSLYAGPVDGMINTAGYFELGANHLQQLNDAIQQLPYFKKVGTENGLLLACLNDEQTITAENLNQMLFEKGIVLNHLVKRKESLEQQFLEITKN